MTDSLIALVPTYGLYIIALGTFLACLALPLPASLLTLTSGAFAAAGELALGSAIATSLGAVFVGDQVAHEIGRRGAGLAEKASKKVADLLKKAEDLSARFGGFGLFLSRWLFSPLGPYMSFATGAARMNRVHFTLWALPGEMIWVSIYFGLGFVFSSQIETIAGVAANVSGFIAGGVVTVVLGLWLRSALKAQKSGAVEAETTGQ